MKVTVNRARWLRGTEGYLGRDGCHCILGFVLLALGVKEEALDGVELPRDLPESAFELVNKTPARIHDNLFDDLEVAQVTAINDKATVDEQDRERRLTEEFEQKWGITLCFEGGENEP